jgi:hypothetical protein
VRPRAKIAQGVPVVSSALHFAIAGGLIAILAAQGANALAILTAYPLHGQSEKDLFPEDIVQFHSAILVKPNFRFTCGDLHLFGACDYRRRPVEQIEARVYGNPRSGKAAIALVSHFHRISTLDSDLALGVRQKFGRAGSAQRGCLLQALLAEIDFARSEGFVETNLSQVHL